MGVRNLRTHPLLWCTSPDRSIAVKFILDLHLDGQRAHGLGPRGSRPREAGNRERNLDTNCADCPPIPHYWFSRGILVEDFHSRHGKTLEDSNDFGPCMSGMPDSVEPMQE